MNGSDQVGCVSSEQRSPSRIGPRLSLSQTGAEDWQAYRDRRAHLLRHGVLLGLGAPCQLRLLAGQEHGWTISLAEPPHSITSSARASSEGGTVMPSASQIFAYVNPVAH